MERFTRLRFHRYLSPEEILEVSAGRVEKKPRFPGSEERIRAFSLNRGESWEVRKNKIFRAENYWFVQPEQKSPEQGRKDWVDRVVQVGVM